jgi:hypothetical protein
MPPDQLATDPRELASLLLYGSPHTRQAVAHVLLGNDAALVATLRRTNPACCRPAASTRSTGARLGGRCRPPR